MKTPGTLSGIVNQDPVRVLKEFEQNKSARRVVEKILRQNLGGGRRKGDGV